ncbi:MAG TPA: hypothetical protein V6D16_22990 [Candidatus Obscuribacterales bacterium]
MTLEILYKTLAIAKNCYASAIAPPPLQPAVKRDSAFLTIQYVRDNRH